jgi:hypothetical protein
MGARVAQPESRPRPAPSVALALGRQSRSEREPSAALGTTQNARFGRDDGEEGSCAASVWMAAAGR